MDDRAIIDRINLEETVAGVVIYDGSGRTLFVSDQLQGASITPPERLQDVLSGDLTVGFDRTIGELPVYSVLRPIHNASNQVVGAFEVAQPLSLLAREIARTRTRFMLNTLTLVAAVTIAMLVLVRHLVARPLEHGPGRTDEARPPDSCDVVARDFLELADLLGA